MCDSLPINLQVSFFTKMLYGRVTAKKYQHILFEDIDGGIVFCRQTLQQIISNGSKTRKLRFPRQFCLEFLTHYFMIYQGFTIAPSMCSTMEKSSKMVKIWCNVENPYLSNYCYSNTSIFTNTRNPTFFKSPIHHYKIGYTLLQTQFFVK